jgi:acetyl-CoA synthetase
VAWITGHTYVVYGPLACGATTFLFEGVPTYPDPDRYWNLVERNKLSQIYLAPTAIRTLMKVLSSHLVLSFSSFLSFVMYVVLASPVINYEKYGDAAVKSNRSTLRVIGSVGEPLNAEAWKWLYDVIGEQRCAIVDTYWQTETGPPPPSFFHRTQHSPQYIRPLFYVFLIICNFLLIPFSHEMVLFTAHNNQLVGAGK